MPDSSSSCVICSLFSLHFRVLQDWNCSFSPSQPTPGHSRVRFISPPPHADFNINALKIIWWICFYLNRIHSKLPRLTSQGNFGYCKADLIPAHVFPDNHRPQFLHLNILSFVKENHSRKPNLLVQFRSKKKIQRNII